MAQEWLDSMLNPQINKEAKISPQGENAADHFEKKLEANAWVEGLMTLDEKQIQSEYEEHLRQEAKALGKTASIDLESAYEMGDSTEETLKKDYARDVSILSDYALAEVVAGIRGHAEQNTPEKFHDHKEEAKKQIASNRKKVEEEVLKATGMSAQVDWKKEFARYTKEATPEQPKEKDLYQPIAPEASHEFQKPTEEKFKLPKDQEKAIPGNGREENERTDATKEAGVLQESITEGLGKVASKEKEAHCGSCPGDPGHEQAGSPLKREELYTESDMCPVCGGEGKDLANGQEDHMACMGCGISYSSKKISKDIVGPSNGKCPNWDYHHIGTKCETCGLDETNIHPIKSHASKEDVIKKVAEIQSPWSVEKLADGTEAIVRREIVSTEEKDLNKESEESKTEELQK